MVIADKPDLILLDIMTGTMHRAVFLERLRQLPEGQNDSKVIVLTNLDNDISRKKFEKPQITDYLVKTVTSIDTIITRIKEVLQ